MSEFKRAKAKPVPKNWRDEVEGINAKIEDYLKSEGYRNLKDPRKRIELTDAYGETTTIAPLERIVPTLEELNSYFETVIVTKEVAEATLRICINAEKKYTGAVPDPEYDDTRYQGMDGRLMDDFMVWWVYTYTDYPLFFQKETRYYFDTGPIDAIFEFLKGGSVEDSYAQINENVEFYIKDAKERPLKVKQRYGDRLGEL